MFCGQYQFPVMFNSIFSSMNLLCWFYLWQANQNKLKKRLENNVAAYQILHHKKPPDNDSSTYLGHKFAFVKWLHRTVMVLQQTRVILSLMLLSRTSFVVNGLRSLYHDLLKCDDCLPFICRKRISLYIWSTRHALMEKCKISRYITHIHRRQNCWKNSLGLQTIFWVVKKFIDAWMCQNGPVVCIHNYDIYISGD